MRWDDHILALDDERLALLWNEPKPTRFVLGVGFDPRATAALERYVALAGDAPRDLIAVRFGIPDDEALAELTAQNLGRLEALASKMGTSISERRRPRGTDDRPRGLRLARDLVPDVLADVERVVIDVSGLPTSIYFPLIGSVLATLQADGDTDGIDVQVLVTEDPALDARLRSEGTLPAAPLGGFNNGLDLDAERPGPRVWTPVLGEGAAAQLDLLRQRLIPDEVCPALPFPAKDPRRADRLVLEHRLLLFDELEAESANFIYADERNPFDLYRALMGLDERYRRALAPLGESMLVLSTHSSKTLSLGVLLAAYERQLPVVSAGPQRHSFDPQPGDERYAADAITGLWIAGEPYRP
jgi:hypothetical protein